MNLYEVIPAKSLGPDSAGFLTYSYPEELPVGTLVIIPLRRAKVPGIILRKSAPVAFPVKPIEKVLYAQPLPPHLLESILWLSEYYLTPPSAIAGLILPNGVEKKRRKPDASLRATGPKSALPSQKVQIPLNPAQKQTLEALESVATSTRLLHGVTGSGKTNIYLKLAQNALENHQSVILLVPEIALTSQLVQIFEQTFGTRITILHSRQTESERHQTWEQLLSATEPQIIIGARSALFAPVQNLGLIIIDESHESAYFQENSPKYSALKLASFMASTLKIPCVQGSATPLVADYYLAREKHALVELTKKAKASAKKPDIKLIDLRNKANFSKNHYFSAPLIASIKRNLAQGHQTLIYHNRRGSAPLTLCQHCGWQALCPSCFLPLTLHTDLYQLVCHACGHQENVPLSCPSCGQPDVIHKGFGTKLLESELHKLFKDARIIRFDADNTKAETLDNLYTEVKSGHYDIIIGTQTVAKGLDLPLLATVGVVQADAGLSLPDYSAEERTFELLTQVIGRVGRGHLDTAEVYIQTYQPDHPVIVSALSEDYQTFSNYLLRHRRRSALPPYTYLAKLSLAYKTEALALKRIKEYQKALSSFPGVSVSAPTPAFHERSNQGYTWQLVVKASSRKALLFALRSLKKSSALHLTLDPPSLL